VRPFVDKLEERRRRDLVRMEAACFATTDAKDVWRLVGEFVEGALGVEPVGVCLYSVSIGAVLGLDLADHRRVVVKVFAPWHDPQFLAAANDVRRHLVADGYPAPGVLAGVRPLGPAHAWIEEWVDAPPPTSHPEAIAALAQHLGDFVLRCRRLAPDPALTRSWQTYERPIGIWRNPPRPDADLAVEVPNATWVQDIAEFGRSVAESAPGPRVIGHIDWRADNVRVNDDGTLAAVFDWDSVQLTDHVHVVAGACAALRPQALARFLAAYGAAVGTPLTTAERRAIAGRVIWTRATWARFELVRGLSEDELRFVPRLQRDVDAYLQAATR
jgi:Ser/Thr protein kinase RdoA (MazF antagonist)